MIKVITEIHMHGMVLRRLRCLTLREMYRLKYDRAIMRALTDNTRELLAEVKASVITMELFAEVQASFIDKFTDPDR